MDKFLINGPCKIKGKVSISGSKNASLPILAATLLFDKPVTIKNLPRVRDIDTMLNLLKSLGSKIILSKDRKTAKIINKKNMKTFASYSLVKTMRGSILVLGPLISKFHKSKTSLPGGCLIGARPVNYHLSALKKLGMEYKIRDGYILAKSNGRLKGKKINFPKISVGATENSIIAACLARGKTILKNCAVEPEIKDLTKFLSQAGANIKWSGRTCTIIGVNSLNQTSHTVMAIQNIKTKEFPGIPTDLQAQLMVLMCKSVGKSSITESIFENRFMHVAELQRLGAKINIQNNKALIEGNTKFIGAELMSSDLRASVALVLAAIVANGKSIVGRVYHLERGYENIENKLQKIGVKIKRLK